MKIRSTNPFWMKMGIAVMQTGMVLSGLGISALAMSLIGGLLVSNDFYVGIMNEEVLGSVLVFSAISILSGFLILFGSQQLWQPPRT